METKILIKRIEYFGKGIFKETRLVRAVSFEDLQEGDRFRAREGKHKGETFRIIKSDDPDNELLYLRSETKGSIQHCLKDSDQWNRLLQAGNDSVYALEEAEKPDFKEKVGIFVNKTKNSIKRTIGDLVTEAGSTEGREKIRTAEHIKKTRKKIIKEKIKQRKKTFQNKMKQERARMTMESKQQRNTIKETEKDRRSADKLEDQEKRKTIRAKAKMQRKKSKKAVREDKKRTRTEEKAKRKALSGTPVRDFGENLLRGFWQGVRHNEFSMGNLAQNNVDEKTLATTLSSLAGKSINEFVTFIPRSLAGFCRGAFLGNWPLDKNDDENQTDKNPSWGSKVGASFGITGRILTWPTWKPVQKVGQWVGLLKK